MSILSDFEDRLGRAVEGVFAGAFRSPVQPAEVAKALARAMDNARLIGVGKVYVPVVYTVALSEADSRELGALADTLAGELETYLIAYSREREYHLQSRPKVRIETSDELKLGRFRVRAESESTPQDASASRRPEQAGSAWDSPVLGENAVVARSSEETPAAPHPIEALATVTVGDIHHDVALQGERVVAGRLSECDICLDDANASRQHVAFVSRADGWWVEDLDSTNGTLVNGASIEEHRLKDGDVIEIGVTKLVYHEPKG